MRMRIQEYFWPWIRDPVWVKFGSGINIPDPQHCLQAKNSGDPIRLKGEFHKILKRRNLLKAREKNQQVGMVRHA